MNRGFSYYSKKSRDLFSFVFRKQRASTRLSFTMYMIASSLGKLLLLTRPIFLVSDQNLANMIVNGHSFAMLKAFHGVRERYFKMLFAEMVKHFVFLSIFFVMVAPFAFLFLHPDGYIVAPFVVGTMSLIALICYFVVQFNYTFAPYVASKNKDIDFSDYLYNSRVSVRGLKGMIFGEYLIAFFAGTFPMLLVLAFPIIFAVNGSAIEIFVPVVVVSAIIIAILINFLSAPVHLKKIMFIFVLGEDACKTSQSVVVKRRASSRIEYDPLFDEPVKSEALDLNKQEEKTWKKLLKMVTIDHLLVQC